MKKLTILPLLLISIGAMAQNKPVEAKKQRPVIHSNYYYMVSYLSNSIRDSFSIGSQNPPMEKYLKSFLKNEYHYDTTGLIIMGISPITEYQFKNYYKK